MTFTVNPTVTLPYNETSMISKVVSDEFRARLVTWMTVNHISYSQVESEAFRDSLQSIITNRRLVLLLDNPAL